MAGDFNKPVVTDNYATVLQAVREVLADMAKGLDPALTLGTANIPANALRWNSAAKRDEIFNGAVWAEKCASYAISIDGSASKWTTGRTIQLTGAVTGTSGAWDGSANISFVTAYSTVPADKGGTGLTTYAIGDLIYASGAAALSRLAGVATGNVLLSGGAGAAPSWGKIGLTTHVSGTLPVANGGTGNTTNTSAACSGTSAYASLWWSASHNGTYYQTCNWDGTYWYITSSHGSPVRVGYADYANSAGSAVDQTARNAAATAQTAANTAQATANSAGARFVSSVLGFPAAGTVASAAHGLGQIPSSISARLVCTVAANGYSVGDEIDITSSYSQSTVRTVFADTASVYYVANFALAQITIYQKGGSTLVAPTAGSWGLILRAVK